MNQDCGPGAAAAHGPGWSRPEALPLVLATALPMLLAYAHPPAPTAVGQIAAVILWGLALATLRLDRAAGAGAWLAGALGLLAASALASWWLGRLPTSLALPPAALLGLAGLLALAGCGAARQGRATPALQAVAWGLLLAGVGNAAAAAVQVFAPGLADGYWVARTDLPGRAIGNLRHPNHLALLLLWATVSAVLLAETRRLPRRALLACAVVLLAALQWTGSRFGLVGLLALVAWAAIDRRLSPATRRLLLLAPVAYGLVFLLMAWWGSTVQGQVGTVARVMADGGLAADVASPNSRLNIWRNAATLLAAHPLTGVGFGEFNLAWTLTPFADRPTALFDHAHNLPLHLAVELGLPLTLLLLGALGTALVLAWRRTREAGAAEAVPRGAALVVVLLVLAQSQLEHPLWFAYLLLPAAFVWGVLLGRPDPAAVAPPATRPGRRHWLSPAVAGLVVLGGLFAVVEYHAVAQVFRPSASRAEAIARTVVGQRTLFFAHWADHVAATQPTTVTSRQLALARAPHALLDPPLLIAWSGHLAAAGDLDRARWLVQRLREFRHPGVQPFLQPCEGPAPRPFQCEPPARTYRWTDFGDLPPPQPSLAR